MIHELSRAVIRRSLERTALQPAATDTCQHPLGSRRTHSVGQSGGKSMVFAVVECSECGMRADCWMAAGRFDAPCWYDPE